MKKLFFSLLLLILCASSIQAQTATTVIFQKDGWDVTSAYTSTLPAPAPGPTITAVVTFEVGGVIQTTTASDSFALPIPVIMTKRIATSNISLVNDYTITNITGDGTAVFDATSGKLVYTVNAPNDGAVHTLKFHLKSKLPGWLVKIPWIRDLFMDRPIFIG